MPRTPRVKGSNQVYHITQRGNNREKVFESDEEKHLFLDILFEARIKYGFYIYAYCIMDNHYHLLLNDNDNDISRILGIINYKYAVRYNFIHKRCGHVFQERFFSEIVDNDIYLFEAIQYIHNNPVRAQILDEPSKYNWSSCR